MSETLEQDEVQTEANELADAMAGYNARGGEPPAVEPETSAPEQPAVEDAPANDDVKQELSPKEELEALKAEVKAIKSTEHPDVVRKLYGEIGNLNRKILELTPKPAPVVDETAAAIEEFENTANHNYPDLVPMAKVMKQLAANKPAPMPDVDAIVTQRVNETRQRDAIEALAEEHPDYETVRDTSEFKQWLGSKPAEYQSKLQTTWNPAVVSKGLSEFKSAMAEKHKKQARLETAVTLQGVPKQGGASTLPDDEGFNVGYYGARGAKRTR